MSGTSADGVDAAVVEIGGVPPDLRVRQVAFLTQPYDDATRAAVLDLCRPDAPLLALGRMHTLLGHRFAEAALAVIAQAGLTPADVALIGSHGQTVYHAPPGRPESLPWGRLSSLPSLPWGRLSSLPSLPWGGLPSLPSLSWGRLSSLPSLPWGGLPSLPSLSWGRLSSLPSLPWGRLSSLPSLPWGGLPSLPNLPWGGLSSLPEAARLPFTLQIGDPAVIAARTGIPAVADFRSADVAAGGQGAPLVPYPDWLMWHHPTRTCALQNIGGIANVTYLPAGGGPESVVAFDTGPGNALIDGIAAHATGGAWRYDRDGALAAQGRVDDTLLARLLDHPYLRQPPPKSTGRETFGAAFVTALVDTQLASTLTPADLAATVTAFTAASIAGAYRRWLPIPPDEVFLCGGGADNPTLVRMIREYLARVFGDSAPIVRHYDETGYSSKAKEAVAFALLAYETWHNRPGNLPQVTGASHPVILGHISKSANRQIGKSANQQIGKSANRKSANQQIANPQFRCLLPITARINVDGHLWLAGCDTVALAEKYGTPLYLYDGATLWQRLAELREALARHYAGPAQVAYAAKAYFTPDLARRLAAAGVGLDVVSGGEMAVAREAGCDPARVHLHGNNKRLAELRAALEWGVGRIVVDNLDELEWLEALIEERNQVLGKNPVSRVPIWLRLTLALDVETHPYRKTGHAASKFGLHTTSPTGECVREDGTSPASQALARARESRWLEVVGLHTHLGSQIFYTAPYAAAVRGMLDFAAAHHFVPAELSPGGGWGAPYTPEDPALPVDEWIAAVSQAAVEGCQARGWPLPRLVVEPGRWLIAPAAVALYRVGTRKTAADGTRYVAVDGGLADNPRPALYGARYTAFLANRATDPPGAPVTVVGRFCESSDVLVQDVRLPEPRPGDLLAVPVAGAYQLSMASRYNLGPVPAVLWLDNETMNNEQWNNEQWNNEQ